MPDTVLGGRDTMTERDSSVLCSQYLEPLGLAASDQHRTVPCAACREHSTL